MQFSITIIFLVMGLGLVTSRLCTNQNNDQINLAQYKIPKTSTYQFAINMRKESVSIQKNVNGTYFTGNFSTLVLRNQQQVEFVYDSVEFGFECPALHKPTKSNQQIIELQIIYRNRINLTLQNNSLKAPYEWVIFSFPFMVSEWVPENSVSISDILEGIKSQKQINLNEFLKQPVKGETMVYTTRHWRFGDKSILRMVRKEIRLMSREQFSRLKLLIQDEIQLHTNDISVSQAVKKPQKIYQIKSYPFEESIAFRKEDL